MRIHFDGDLLIYRAGFAAEKAIYYIGSGAGTVRVAPFQSKKEAVKFCEENGYALEEIRKERNVEPVANALYNCKSILKRTCDALQSADLIVYLSGPDNFRDGVATIKPYKGNRDDLHKPVHGPAIIEFLKKRYNVVVSENEEADDVVAYSHYRMWCEDETSTVLCSTDKDLNMVPGLHYNFVKEEAYHVSPEQGEQWFMQQLLMGDSTDNIPGVPGIGKVKALRALEEGLWGWDVIRTLYVQGYGDDWFDALVENGRLLWMRLEPNQWWNPPEEVCKHRESSSVA